jgi:hypothetical protein
MIAIPNMDKPKRCMYCIAFTLQEAPTHYAYDEPPYVYPYCELLEREVDDDTIPNDCPLIEIVTCGECKWSYTDERDGTLWCKVHMSHYRVDGDGFCYLGERRE